jgi:hypothetical protein
VPELGEAGVTLPALSNTDRWKLKELTLEQSSILPAGKIMYCRGRKILGYASFETIGNVFAIPQRADTLAVSSADYEQIKGWLR